MINRVFWIVADSFGIGDAPDAAAFGDSGTNTLVSCFATGQLEVPVMRSLGLFNIDGITVGTPVRKPLGSFARVRECSAGKDTTVGHWEMCGVHSRSPLPTYPDGFPEEITSKLKALFGCDILCNLPYSGTKVIADYGEQHVKTGCPIVYTSADSVLQIAAHEEVIPLEMLYRYCEQVRDMMKGEHGVGRVIARPFVGDSEKGFTRTANRHDYSLTPPHDTVLDTLKAHGKEVIGVGKIHDIFAGQGLTRTIRTKNNTDGLQVTQRLLREDFEGLCFVNLVDFDMVYGHRRDANGYTAALCKMDAALGEMLPLLCETDMLILTADHGCDPAAHGTDHTRETVPLLIYSPSLKSGVNLGTRTTFADIGATVSQWLRVPAPTVGTSFAKELTK